MAVTIDEITVDVAPNAAPSAAPDSAGGEGKKDTNLGQVLEILRERLMRLRAD
jgi:hypothetical protein